MAKKIERNIIVGLDIGTSKVAAIVAEHTGNDEIEIIGIGRAPSKGLKKGVVVNLESTVHSIQRAVEEAELMAGCQIRSVFAGIAGSHIKSLNSHGIVAIKDKRLCNMISTGLLILHAQLPSPPIKKYCIFCPKNL